MEGEKEKKTHHDQESNLETFLLEGGSLTQPKNSSSNNNDNNNNTKNKNNYT